MDNNNLKIRRVKKHGVCRLPGLVFYAVIVAAPLSEMRGRNPFISITLSSFRLHGKNAFLYRPIKI
jgi:hypothetical protein